TKSHVNFCLFPKFVVSLQQSSSTLGKDASEEKINRIRNARNDMPTIGAETATNELKVSTEVKEDILEELSNELGPDWYLNTCKLFFNILFNYVNRANKPTIFTKNANKDILVTKSNLVGYLLHDDET